MRIFILFLLILNVCTLSSSQNRPVEFSALSGTKIFSTYLLSVPGGYILDLHGDFDSSILRRPRFLYRLDEQGKVLGSFELNTATKLFFGKPVLSSEGKLCFAGMYNIRSVPNSQRYAAIQFDSMFGVINTFESPTFYPSKGVFFTGYTDDGHTGPLFDFSVKNDTIFGFGRYILVDQTILGQSHFYFKANFNGDIYADFENPSVMLYNCFFKENLLYIQGSCSNPSSPWNSVAVGLYNHEGAWVRGWNFDNFGSGEFPWGACGGIIDDRLYFSYGGRDPNLPGCPVRNVAIDVRDLNFNILHRFKINECGYLYAGNMPFAKGADGSIYFQAVHDSYKKFLLQKYTVDMKLIWSKEFEPQTDAFISPMQIVPSGDGGVVISCLQELNNIKRIHLYKFSSDGNPVVSAQEVTYEPLRPEPSVLAPNPCRDFVRYTGTHDGSMLARLHSADGRVVRLLRLEDGVLDVSTLPPGLYSVLVLDAADTQQVLHRQTLVKAWD
jgi:hypothetical protein